MKINKKKIMKIILIIFILLLVITILLILNSKEKNIKCIYTKDNLKITKNIEIDKDIIINTIYENKFEKMDDVVDNYDREKMYLDIISKYDGIKSNIEQEKYNLKYNIEINLNNLTEEVKTLQEVKNIIYFKKYKNLKIILNNKIIFVNNKNFPNFWKVLFL